MPVLQCYALQVPCLQGCVTRYRALYSVYTVEGYKKYLRLHAQAKGVQALFTLLQLIVVHGVGRSMDHP